VAAAADVGGTTTCAELRPFGGAHLEPELAPLPEAPEALPLVDLDADLVGAAALAHLDPGHLCELVVGKPGELDEGLPCGARLDVDVALREPEVEENRTRRLEDLLHRDFLSRRRCIASARCWGRGSSRST
jgi:hypothetical protein